MWQFNKWHSISPLCPDSCHTNFVPEKHSMFDELWSEIQDSQGEIFDMDIPELKDEKFDVNEYLKGNIDY